MLSKEFHKVLMKYLRGLLKVILIQAHPLLGHKFLAQRIHLTCISLLNELLMIVAGHGTAMVYYRQCRNI